MTIRNIITTATEGHTLNKPADPVYKSELDSNWIHELIKDMYDTLMSFKYATGLSAPQIGVNKQVIVWGGKAFTSVSEPSSELTVLVNPYWMPLDSTQIQCWEHCMSLPKMRGKTQRYNRIYYAGLTPDGQPIESEAQSALAVLIQHEIEHLKGCLLTERLADTNEFGLIEDFEAKRGEDHHKRHGVKIVKEDGS